MRVGPHNNLPPSPPSRFTGTSSEDGATFAKMAKNSREMPEKYEGGKKGNCHLRATFGGRLGGLPGRPIGRSRDAPGRPIVWASRGDS